MTENQWKRSFSGGIARSAWVLGLVCVLGLPMAARADEADPDAPRAEPAADAAAEMARKLQNPLANIRALMTDNAIGFETGDDEGTSYSFQLQPVYALVFPTADSP